jgi:hypothetical protein
LAEGQPINLDQEEAWLMGGCARDWLAQNSAQPLAPAKRPPRFAPESLIPINH